MTVLSRSIGSGWFAWPLLAAPGLFALSDVTNHGPWETEELQVYLGNSAVALLVTALCMTPLRVLFPSSDLAAALNRHRRKVGVSSFVYASAHVWVFFRAESSLATATLAVADQVYLQAGLLAYGLLTLLAVTSNDRIVAWLGYPRWKLIHRLAYIIAFLAFFHRGFGEESGALGTTLLIFGSLALLEALRVLRRLAGQARRGAEWLARPHPAWSDWREFKVARKVRETSEVSSIYFVPTDGRAVPNFLPGQYLTYEFPSSGEQKPIIRCYSLSSSPNGSSYRASVKRQAAPRDHPEAPPGEASTFVNDVLSEGDVIRARAPMGEFFLRPRGRFPVVLIGSGIGVTPVLSMLQALASQNSRRTVWFFYGTRNRAEDALRGEVEEAVRALPNAHLVVCHSRPEEGEQQHVDYDYAERISVDLLKRVLPKERLRFYFCGPGPLMESLGTALPEWGVRKSDLHFEAFGPASLQTRSLPQGASRSAVIEFVKSGKTLEWKGLSSSLLEFAESEGIELTFGCRAGNCGTCRVPVLEGEVVYWRQPAVSPGNNGCLACMAVPASDLKIDA